MTGKHGRQRERTALVTVAAWIGVLLLVLGVVGALVLQLRAEEDPPAASVAPCTERDLVVAVTERVRAVVQQALETTLSGEDRSCVRLQLQVRTAADVADGVGLGGELPDLWVADGGWAATRLARTGVGLETVTPALALTPVMLVGGAGVERPGSWGAAMGSGALAMPDPLVDPVGVLALEGPRAESAAVQRRPGEARRFVVPTAQAYGERVATGRNDDLSLDTLTPVTTRIVAVAEQDVVGSSDGKDVTPRTGALPLRFPLYVAEDAEPVVRGIAEDVAGWFAGEDGTAALEHEGLRVGDGTPIGPMVGAGGATLLPVPRAASIEQDLRTWQTMGVPSSVLAVFDVSGSMDFDAPGGGTRIDLAVEVALTALDIFPDHARIGLWAFSIGLGGDTDHRVLEPVRRLDRDVRGASQRDRLRARARQLRTITEGDTGLYDTALAAYRQGVEDYDPNYSNTVILMTDGTNDDPDAISRRDLLSGLRAAVDPQRPVRIVAIGLTGDADLSALREIAAATGGRAHRADTPQDVLGIFALEIASR